MANSPNNHSHRSNCAAKINGATNVHRRKRQTTHAKNSNNTPFSTKKRHPNRRSRLKGFIKVISTTEITNFCIVEIRGNSIGNMVQNNVTVNKFVTINLRGFGFPVAIALNNIPKRGY